MIDQNELRKKLLGHTTSRDSQIRQAAYVALANLGASGAPEKVLQGTQDENASVRRAALVALLKMCEQNIRRFLFYTDMKKQTPQNLGLMAWA